MSNPSHRPWTGAEQRKLEELWIEGKSVRQIARVLDRSYSSIVQRRRALNLPKRYYNIPGTSPRDQQLLARFKGGASIKELTDEFDLTSTRVYQILARGHSKGGVRFYATLTQENNLFVEDLINSRGLSRSDIVNEALTQMRLGMSGGQNPPYASGTKNPPPD